MTRSSLPVGILLAIGSLLAACEPAPAVIDGGPGSADASASDSGPLARRDGAPGSPDAAVSTSGCEPDRFPPTIPQELTAELRAGVVHLAWEPSSDDVGVVAYRVFRDGAEVARTSAPEHADAVGLVAGSTHAYWVDALDAAGLESGRSLGVSAAIPPRSGVGLDDSVDDDGDGWLETSGGFRIRASHPRVVCTPEHLETVLARMHGPTAREPYSRWFRIIREAAESGAAVSPLGYALLYRATGEQRWLDVLLPRFEAATLDRDPESLHALDLVFDDVPPTVLRAVQARFAGRRDVFHYDAANIASRGEATWGYHSAGGVAPALTYAGVFALTDVELDPAAPADRFDTLGYLRAVHEELLPTGQFWRIESHIAGDPSFRGRARIGAPGGMYDNFGYDGAEESASVYVLHGWGTLTGQPRHRGALHDEHRARFWHSLREPYSERVATSDGYCARAGSRSGRSAIVWNTGTTPGQPRSDVAALTAWLYQDGLMQEYFVHWRDVERCTPSPAQHLAHPLLFFDDSLAPVAPESLPRAHYFGGPGIVSSRASWDSAATFLVALAGDGISRRYEDAASFLLSRRGPIVLHAGRRIRFEPDNDRHHWYHVRSVSKNTLRIYDPGEVFDDRGALATPHALVPSDNLGGQMFETMYAREDLAYPIDSGGVSGRRAPASSPISGLVDVGNVLRYEHRPGVFTYALAEGTPAYGSHVELFERAFVHVLPDVVVLYDRVRVARDDVRRVWTAHTIARPTAPGAPPAEHGLTELGAASVLSLEGAADAVSLHLVLPEARDVRVRGGETLLHAAPLRSSAPWAVPIELPQERWLEVRAAGADVAGSVEIAGVDARGAAVSELVTFGAARRIYLDARPTAVRAGEIDVAGAGWARDQWAGYLVELASPTRTALITGNDEDTLFADVPAGSAYRVVVHRLLGNTRQRFARITSVTTSSVDASVLELAVPHHFDTPDASGRVHSFSPHSDARHDDWLGGDSLGAHTLEVESLEVSRDSRFLVAFSMADPGEAPPTVERAAGEALEGVVVGGRVAVLFARDRGSEAGEVALPGEVSEAYVFGLEPGAHYQVSLAGTLHVVRDDDGTTCASADGVVGLTR